MENNLVSVVIVNYNGKEYLRNCLHSIQKNNYPNWEAIVVENCSTDGSVEMMEKEFSYFPNIHLIKLSDNFGPAYARNKGVEIAKGGIIGFLDNDTEVDSNWINNAVKYYENDSSLGILQCKLLMFKNRKLFDYAGEYLGSLGFLVHRASYEEEDHGQYDCPAEILAAKSAGMFIRKDVFDKIKGFDDDYFIFVEETDLGWRSWLAGYRAIFAYDSVVFHHFSSTKKIVDPSFNNRLIRFHGTKNYALTLYKNLSLKNLIIILPKHIILWIGLSFYLLTKGNFSSFINIIEGLFWNIFNLHKNYLKRKLIQKNRVITDKEFFKKIYRKRGVPYYIKKFLSAQKKLSTPENQKK